MSDMPLKEIDRKVHEALKPPIVAYYFILAVLGALVSMGLLAWIYQVRTGMGVSGLNHPVGWGVYITNFVFWVGIAHSGTLISAIFYLVRAKWRDAISRSAEAMTLIAILIAGLFPLVHLGRFWVFYYILPYFSERQIWPNFKSALVWDVIAVFTYFTVSLIFFFVGLIPDAAAARDHWEEKRGRSYWRSRFYRTISLGWSGAMSQWRHYDRVYLYFAALATPLVISVHSIVSWDFATGLLPGWHSTLFAPYFVAGAIHSGLAMVIVIMVPMRKIFSLESIITPWHLDMIAKTMIVTTLVMAYSYIIEPFMAEYSHNIFEQQFFVWRRTGWLAWCYYPMLLLNVIVPLSLVSRRVRAHRMGLFFIGLMVLAGMWLERFFIIVGSTAHDFLPHNWDTYTPSWVEATITIASASLFLFLFMIFSKMLPVVATTDVKSQIDGEEKAKIAECSSRRKIEKERTFKTLYRYVFADRIEMLKAAKTLCEKGFTRLEIFSPTKLTEIESILPLPISPVKLWTLIGVIGGGLFGLVLTIGPSDLNALIVGGKPPVTLIPYWIVAFEGAVLFGAAFNLVGLVIHARLFHTKPMLGYDARFGRDRYAIVVEASPSAEKEMKDLGSLFIAEEMGFVPR